MNPSPSPEVIASTVVNAVLHAALLARLDRSDDGLRVVVARPSRGRPDPRTALETSTAWIDVAADGSRTLSSGCVAIPEVERAIGKAFDPVHPRAANVQFIRLDASDFRAVRHHKRPDLIGVLLDDEDIVPSWTPNGAALLAALLLMPSPQRPDAIEGALEALQGDAAVNLDGFLESEARWLHAQRVNHQLRRIGVNDRYQAHPGAAGDTTRVPIHVWDRGRRDIMPGWRLDQAKLIALLRTIPAGAPISEVRSAFDSLAGPELGLLDWKP